MPTRAATALTALRFSWNYCEPVSSQCPLRWCSLNMSSLSEGSRLARYDETYLLDSEGNMICNIRVRSFLTGTVGRFGPIQRFVGASTVHQTFKMSSVEIPHITLLFQAIVVGLFVQDCMIRAVPEIRIELPGDGGISARRRERTPMSSPCIMSMMPLWGHAMSRR